MHTLKTPSPSPSLSPVPSPLVRLLATGLLVAAMVPALPAGAQTGGAHIEITPQIGYRAEGIVETTYQNVLTDDTEVQDGEVLGLTIGIPISRHFLIEFLARRQETQLFRDGGVFSAPRTIGDIDIDHYHVGALYQWGSGQVMPFVTGSMGLARLDVDLGGADSEEKLSASFGGGVKVYFSDNVGLRFEGRGFWTNLEQTDNNCDRNGHSFCCDEGDCFDYDDEDGIYQSEATIGLILRF